MKKRPSPEPTATATPPDLVIQRIQGAPLVLIRPTSDRGRHWITRETDAGDSEPLAQHGGAYPVDAEYLAAIVRGALAARLVIAEEPTKRARRARRARRAATTARGAVQ